MSIITPARLAVAGTVAVGALSFSLSYTALTDLAADHHVPAGQAWMVPLVVDGLVVVSTIASAAAKRKSSRVYAWFLLVLGTLLSVAGNVTHAWLLSDGNPISCVIAAVPPVIQLAVWHLTMMLWNEKTEEVAQAPVLEVVAQEEEKQLAAA